MHRNLPRIVDQGGDPPCWAHLIDESPDDGLLIDLDALSTGEGDGVTWSLPHGGDLDANLIRLGPRAAIEEHRNDDVDVLVVVQSGTGEIVVGDSVREVARDQLMLIPRGSRRAIHASEHGLVYLSIHRARGPLTVRPRR